MERRNKPCSYFFIGYLIQYNKPQRRYARFKSMAEIFEDETLKIQPNDYIFKKSKGGFIYVYYLFTKKGWKELPEIIEYDQDSIHTDLKYLQ